VRQKWYKEKTLQRQYRKEVKQYEATASRHADGASVVARGGRKRAREIDASDAAGDDHGDGKRVEGSAYGKDGEGGSYDGGNGRSPKKRGDKKAAGDLFAKEKKAAHEAREAREANAARIAQAEADRVQKLHQRKLASKKRAERDSRGRPRVRNTIQDILGKLQAGK
jgi:hypothetical protein